MKVKFFHETSNLRKPAEIPYTNAVRYPPAFMSAHSSFVKWWRHINMKTFQEGFISTKTCVYTLFCCYMHWLHWNVNIEDFSTHYLPKVIFSACDFSLRKSNHFNISLADKTSDRQKTVCQCEVFLARKMFFKNMTKKRAIESSKPVTVTFTTNRMVYVLLNSTYTISVCCKRYCYWL